MITRNSDFFYFIKVPLISIGATLHTNLLASQVNSKLKGF